MRRWYQSEDPGAHRVSATRNGRPDQSQANPHDRRPYHSYSLGRAVRSPPLVESTVDSTVEAVLKRTPSYFSTYSKWASLLERVLDRVNHSVITIDGEVSTQSARMKSPKMLTSLKPARSDLVNGTRHFVRKVGKCWLIFNESLNDMVLVATGNKEYLFHSHAAK